MTGVRRHFPARFVAMLMSLAILLFSAACVQAGETTAALGEEVTLAIGESVVISDDELSIRFVDVVADSRCPSGVTCVWAGQVSCLLEIKGTGPDAQPEKVVLTQPGLSDGPAVQPFDSYEIAFRVEPYPEAGEAIPMEDYRLVMTVSRR